MNELMKLDSVSRKVKLKVSLLSIIIVGIIIRLVYFPYELPLVIDAMDNFTYATAINYYGHLPTEWTPANNGWPMFLSFWFSIINLENSFQYMQLQRLISVILSSLIAVPVYFLCKRFFDEKLALVGAALFVFDPRIILNSLLGITEPLFILLGITSLVVFLRHGRKETALAFALAACCTVVRSEGIFLFFTLTVFFVLKYRISKDIVKTYLPSLLVFLLILTPIMNYRMETIGSDGIFLRVSSEGTRILSDTSQGSTTGIVSGLELFTKYLGWVMIPGFLVFLPFGFIQYLRNRTKETNFIIIFLISSSIPILYAYTVQAQDTRYLYFLYPIFCLISLFAVKSYLAKVSKKNLAIVIIIAGILISSIGFYEYKKMDYEKEKELNEIARIVADMTNGINFHPSETRYIRAAELPNEWPFLFHDGTHKIKSISTKGYFSIEKYISDSKKNGLTHLLVDDNMDLPEFLQYIYYNEERYGYLNKVFDSKDLGFKHRVKLFEIDLQKFESIDNQSIDLANIESRN